MTVSEYWTEAASARVLRQPLYWTRIRIWINQRKVMRQLVVLGLLLASGANAGASVCYGTTSDGWLEEGVALPADGANFEAYSSLGRLAGRTYVHSTVRDIVVAAYDRLATEQPTKVYKYAETGFENGGRFRPHRTHRNGLSVDFMVPVLDPDGHSVHLPTHPFNKFGYNIEFDGQGRYEDLRIDYEAMAAHLVALHKEALARDQDLWRVIFDPQLQSALFETRAGEYLKQHLQFSTRPAWVRHDEHYHVDFDVPCEPTAASN